MRSIMSRTRRSAMMAGLGAAAAYLLDPDNGEFRRRDIAARVRQVLDRTPSTPPDGGATVPTPCHRTTNAARHGSDRRRDADRT